MKTTLHEKNKINRITKIFLPGSVLEQRISILVQRKQKGKKKCGFLPKYWEKSFQHHPHPTKVSW